MKRISTLGKTLALSLLLLGVSAADASAQKKSAPAATFTNWTYTGEDDIYNANPLKQNEFYSPILQGCYPDPAICRKGDDYYLVNSSFAMFPGVPIFHSTDLVNWEQIGHVLDRTSQLNPDDCGISAGIYAPAIHYNKYNDTFYMVTTEFCKPIGRNLVVKTKDPRQGWSDPIDLKFGGIDPSMFFDDNGKAYMVHNDEPRVNLYGPNHRCIKIWEYDLEKDCIIPGTDSVIVNGGTDLEKKPVWIEGPHIYKKNGKYYLMCAEGGTGDWHSEVIFVADNVYGPYEPWNNNPILTQRHFLNMPGKLVDWAGHADLVEGKDGKYYGVFLGIRPNSKGNVNTGRETFILPVDWSGKWPVFENGLVPLQIKQKMPAGVENKTGKNGFMPNGNFTYSEDFKEAKIDYRWIAMRGPKENFVKIGKKGGLEMTALDAKVSEVKPISALFQRQQHIKFSANSTLTYNIKTAQKAGIVCYQNEACNYVLAVQTEGKEQVLVLEKTVRPQNAREFKTEIVAKQSLGKLTAPITLKVSSDGLQYQFAYSVNGAEMQNIGTPLGAEVLSTNYAGGFTGALVGMIVEK